MGKSVLDLFVILVNTAIIKDQTLMKKNFLKKLPGFSKDCPVCGGDRLSRAKKRGFSKVIYYTLPISLIRCMSCGHRYWGSPQKLIKLPRLIIWSLLFIIPAYLLFHQENNILTNSVSANIASEATTQKQNIDTVNAAADTDIVKQDTETKSESMIVAESTSNNEMKQKPLFDNSTQNFKLSRLAYLGMLSRKKP